MRQNFTLVFLGQMNPFSIFFVCVCLDSIRHELLKVLSRQKVYLIFLLLISLIVLL